MHSSDAQIEVITESLVPPEALAAGCASSGLTKRWIFLFWVFSPERSSPLRSGRRAEKLG